MITDEKTVHVNPVWEEIEVTIPRKRIEWDGKTPILSPGKNGMRIYLEESFGFSLIKDKDMEEEVARALDNAIINSSRKALSDGNQQTDY